MSFQNTSLDIESAYVAHKDDVMRFLVSFGVAAAEAEDITQDAFLRVIQPSPGAKPPENFFRWLLTCTKNLAINRHRRKQWEVATLRETWQRWESTLPGTEESVESRLQKKQLILQVHRALDNVLSPVEKNSLLLRSRGATYREIAFKLEITMDRAIYVTGRAIDKVHKELGKSV